MVIEVGDSRLVDVDIRYMRKILPQALHRSEPGQQWGEGRVEHANDFLAGPAAVGKTHFVHQISAKREPREGVVALAVSNV